MYPRPRSSRVHFGSILRRDRPHIEISACAHNWKGNPHRPDNSSSAGCLSISCCAIGLHSSRGLQGELHTFAPRATACCIVAVSKRPVTRDPSSERGERPTPFVVEKRRSAWAVVKLRPAKALEAPEPVNLLVHTIPVDDRGLSLGGRNSYSKMIRIVAACFMAPIVLLFYPGEFILGVVARAHTDPTVIWGISAVIAKR